MIQKPNIILVGMPGAGKSTLGVLLAKKTARSFIDTDLIIQEREHRTLQAIMDQEGYLSLRRIEERVLLSLDCRGHVIASGGSAVYSSKAMTHLKQSGKVIFLDVPYPEIRKRVKDYKSRGIAKCPGQSFNQLFDERHSLYCRYADGLISCRSMTMERVLRLLIQVSEEMEGRVH